MNINWLSVVLVLILSIVTEVFYTGFAHFVSRGNKRLAPLCSALIALGKGSLVYIYTKEPIQIATLAVGQYIGTLIMLDLLEQREQRANL